MNNAHLENILYEESSRDYIFDEGLTILLSGPIAPMISFSSMGSNSFRSPSSGSGYRSLGVDLTLLPDLGSFSSRYRSASTYVSPIIQDTLDYILESTKPFQIHSTSLRSSSTPSFKSLIDNNILDSISISTKKFEIPSASIQPLKSHNYRFSEDLAWMNNTDADYFLPKGIKSPSTSLRSFSTSSFKSLIDSEITDNILKSTKKFEIPSASIKPLPLKYNSGIDSEIQWGIDNILESTKPFQLPSASIKSWNIKFQSKETDFSESFKSFDVLPSSFLKDLPKVDLSKFSYKNDDYVNTDIDSLSIPKNFPKFPLKLESEFDLTKFKIPRLDSEDLRLDPTKSVKEILGYDPTKIDDSFLLSKFTSKRLDSEDNPILSIQKFREPFYKYTPTYTPPLILDDEDTKISPFKFARKLVEDGLLERYKEMSEGLKLSDDAVSSLRITGTRKIPQFDLRDYSIDIPAVTPKTFDFLHDKSENEYRDIAINSFLPHEMGHAKVFSTFKKESLMDDDLRGFNEHLADTFVAKANIPQSTRTKLWDAENMFQSSTFNTDENADEPYLKTDYTKYLNKKNPFLLGYHTNIQELPNLAQFRERETAVLNDSLTNLGYKPKPIIARMDDLAEDYRSASERLYDFSQKFQFKFDSTQERVVSSILENIRKKTSNFLGDL